MEDQTPGGFSPAFIRPESPTSTDGSDRDRHIHERDDPGPFTGQGDRTGEYSTRSGRLPLRDHLTLASSPPQRLPHFDRSRASASELLGLVQNATEQIDQLNRDNFQYRQFLSAMWSMLNDVPASHGYLKDIGRGGSFEGEDPTQAGARMLKATQIALSAIPRHEQENKDLRGTVQDLRAELKRKQQEIKSRDLEILDFQQELSRKKQQSVSLTSYRTMVDDLLRKRLPALSSIASESYKELGNAQEFPTQQETRQSSTFMEELEQELSLDESLKEAFEVLDTDFCVVNTSELNQSRTTVTSTSSVRRENSMADQVAEAGKTFDLLEKQFAAWRASYRSLHRNCENEKRNRKELEQQVAHWKRLSAKASEEKETLTREISTVHHQVAQLREESEPLKIQSERLRDREYEIDSLKKRVERLTHELDHTGRSEAEMQVQIRNLKDELAHQAELTRRGHKAVEEQHNSEKATWRVELRRLEEDCRRTTELSEERRQMIEELRTQLTTVSVGAVSRSTEVNRVAEMEEELRQLEESYRRQRERYVSDFEEEAAALRREAQGLKEQRNALQMECEELQAKLVSVQAQLSRQISATEETQRDKESYHAQLETIRVEVRTLVKERETLWADTAGAEELKKQIESGRKLRESLEEQHEEEVKNLKSQIQTLKASESKVAELEEELRAQADSARRAKDRLTEEHEAEKRSLRGQIQSNRLLELQEELEIQTENARRQRERLIESHQEELEVQSHNVAAYKEQLRQARQSEEEMGQRCHGAEVQLARETALAQELTRERDRLLVQVEETKTELQAFLQENEAEQKFRAGERARYEELIAELASDRQRLQAEHSEELRAHQEEARNQDRMRHEELLAQIEAERQHFANEQEDSRRSRREEDIDQKRRMAEAEQRRQTAYSKVVAALKGKAAKLNSLNTQLRAQAEGAKRDADKMEAELAAMVRPLDDTIASLGEQPPQDGECSGPCSEVRQIKLRLDLLFEILRKREGQAAACRSPARPAAPVTPRPAPAHHHTVETNLSTSVEHSTTTQTQVVAAHQTAQVQHKLQEMILRLNQLHSDLQDKDSELCEQREGMEALILQNAQLASTLAITRHQLQLTQGTGGGEPAAKVSPDRGAKGPP